MMSMNLIYIAILNIKGADYCCITSRISNSEATNLMQNIGSGEKKKQSIAKYINPLSHRKVFKEILILSHMEIENKINFTTTKTLFFLEDIDMKKELVCNKIYSGEKNYKYCYLHNDHKFKPLHIMLPKTSACVKRMYFLIKDDDL